VAKIESGFLSPFEKREIESEFNFEHVCPMNASIRTMNVYFSD
jgi:hypothetical protein